MTARRSPGRPFQPGQSGNPTGRPKAILEVTTLARASTATAFATLIGIAQDHAAPAAARVSAATAILDRGWGRPTQPLTGEGGERPIAMTFTWLPPEQPNQET